ncbi:MAG: thiamine-phosphate diphosphorylase [Aeromicrobium sp.]|uniref:thiamine phosphate synthase n=1 Tax=Aeromicrobium sp. TaxID=1871063 RepID=UPI00260C7F9B|nr:thiamine phosphate synthase [Aeromicrobium sp.]MCW2823284.1 thiamine-phosphate diphosphorylase [Aeromicrobium sp.]
MLPRIHLITHFDRLDHEALRLVTAVVDAGVDAIQVRAKEATDRQLVVWTRAVVQAVHPRGAQVIVNDRLDLALAAGADGVHLGSDDLPVADARLLAPSGFLIGATCRGRADAQRARADGADYAGVGPVHASTTKTALPDPIGLDALSAAALTIPTIAIGGITADRVPTVLRAGAYGVAVVAAVWQALDPPRAAKEIVDLVCAA